MTFPPLVPMVWIAAALAAGMGCAGSADTAAKEPDSANAAAPADRPAEGEPAISRSALLAALDRGPGALLQSVEVEARFEGGMFSGWQIIELRGDAANAPPMDIRPGDVIKAVNGHGLERPEYLHAVFVELRTADAIVVEGERDGAPFQLRVPIVDDLEGRPAGGPSMRRGARAIVGP